LLIPALFPKEFLKVLRISALSPSEFLMVLLIPALFPVEFLQVLLIPALFPKEFLEVLLFPALFPTGKEFLMVSLILFPFYAPCKSRVTLPAIRKSRMVPILPIQDLTRPKNGARRDLPRAGGPEDWVARGTLARARHLGISWGPPILAGI
jgi:hypothetical protein